MTKEDRLYIIKKYKELREPDAPLETIISRFIYDELKYVPIKCLTERLNVADEIEKVIQIYAFDRDSLPVYITSWIRCCIQHPELAAMGHVDLNDYVSYIGEYYDGTPTSKYRREGRYKIEPIKLQD